MMNKQNEETIKKQLKASFDFARAALAGATTPEERDRAIDMGRKAWKAAADLFGADFADEIAGYRD